MSGRSDLQCKKCSAEEIFFWYLFMGFARRALLRTSARGEDWHKRNVIHHSGSRRCACSMCRRPPCSRSTRQSTPMTFMPASRVASMAVMVEPPVVQTSSTMTTVRAALQGSLRRGVRCRGPSRPCGRGTRARSVGVGAVVFFGVELEELSCSRRAPRQTGRGGVRDQRVGAHGEAADGFGLREVFADEVEQHDAGEAATLGVQRGDAAVDVIVRALAGGEQEVAKPERVSSDEVQKSFARSHDLSPRSVRRRGACWLISAMVSMRINRRSMEATSLPRLETASRRDLIFSVTRRISFTTPKNS